MQISARRVVWVVMIALGACTSDSTADRVATGPLSTTTPIAPLACDSEDDLAAIEALVRSGQPAYDYQPARDVAQLVDWSDVVVSGTIASVERTGGYTKFNVIEVEQLAGVGVVDQIGSMSFWAASEGADPLAEPVEFDSVVFVAFLEEFANAPGGWTPFVEGFGFACSATSSATASLAGLTRGTTELSLAEMADEVRAVAAGVPGAGTLGIARPSDRRREPISAVWS
jgi:hypothetical protein